MRPSSELENQAFDRQWIWRMVDCHLYQGSWVDLVGLWFRISYHHFSGYQCQCQRVPRTGNIHTLTDTVDCTHGQGKWLNKAQRN